jgi:hypothetical protein
MFTIEREFRNEHSKSLPSADCALSSPTSLNFGTAIPKVVLSTAPAPHHVHDRA